MGTAEQMRQASLRGWARAARLVRLAGHGKSNDARSFLAQLNGDKDPSILDSVADKRTSTVRELITGFEDWLQARDFDLHCDLVRKGIPDGGATDANRKKGLKTAKFPGRQNKKANPADIDATVLIDLRQLQRKHGVTLEDLLCCIDVLGHILNSPIDIDSFLSDVQNRNAEAAAADC